MKRIWPTLLIGAVSVTAGALAAWQLWNELTTTIAAVLDLARRILEAS